MMATPAISIPHPRRFPRQLWIVLSGVLVAGIVLGGATACGGDDQSESGEPVTGVTEVVVRDNDFEPDAIAVPVGTTVTWQWEGDNNHNVVGDGFESPVQDSGQFAYTFADPGTYAYRCTLHGGMRGEVVVNDEPSA